MSWHRFCDLMSSCLVDIIQRRRPSIVQPCPNSLALNDIASFPLQTLSMAHLTCDHNCLCVAFAHRALFYLNIYFCPHCTFVFFVYFQLYLAYFCTHYSLVLFVSLQNKILHFFSHYELHLNLSMVLSQLLQRQFIYTS